MIEILFAESEAASMKVAKNKIVAGTVNGPTSLWMAGKKKPPKRPPFAGWVEGMPQEVICLGFMMDIGDIREPADGLYRKKLIYSIYSRNQWEQDEEMEESLKRAGDACGQELLRLKQFLDDGEAVRIWYSDAPYSRCGFYHLCSLLKNYENEVRTVKLPEYAAREKSISVYRNWGDIAAEEFAGFLPYEKNLSREEAHFFAGLWSELVEDNSPLRAVINGRVVGVPEDFYDFQIWARLTHEPVKQARLIGDILGRFPMSVGDWWYAGRIEHYIRQGKICIAQDSKNKYARMICACL